MLVAGSKVSAPTGGTSPPCGFAILQP